MSTVIHNEFAASDAKRLHQYKQQDSAHTSRHTQQCLSTVQEYVMYTLFAYQRLSLMEIESVSLI